MCRFDRRWRESLLKTYTNPSDPDFPCPHGDDVKWEPIINDRTKELDEVRSSIDAIVPADENSKWVKSMVAQVEDVLKRTDLSPCRRRVFESKIIAYWSEYRKACGNDG